MEEKKGHEAEPYRTTDLGCSAYLLTKGFKLLGIEGEKGGRRVFNFEPEAKSIAASYYGGVEIGARAIVSAIRDLKYLIRET